MACTLELGTEVMHLPERTATLRQSYALYSGNLQEHTMMGKKQSDWHGRRTLVTGGCSFIGSHLVDALIARGASVRVVDNLSSGKKEHIQHLIDRVKDSPIGSPETKPAGTVTLG